MKNKDLIDPYYLEMIDRNDVDNLAARVKMITAEDDSEIPLNIGARIKELIGELIGVNS